MYCFQCQEATNGVACTSKAGYCGKPADVANLQDLLVYTAKGIAYLNIRAKEANIERKEYDKFIIDSLFATITNVNFDKNYFTKKISDAITIRESLKNKLAQAGINILNAPDCVNWSANTNEEFEMKAATIGVMAESNPDIRSLKELTMYGIKGLAAYVEHAAHLNYYDQTINDFISHGLDELLREDISADQLVALVLETGKFGVSGMGLLDKGHTETYGHPEISKVNIGVKNNPGILISGHDLKDIEMLLEQTQGTGVDVYTHSEMLPAHYYPNLKKYSNLVGNYGSSWWRQTEEFETFNGPILFTTNCLVPPRRDSKYADKVYTSGVVGFEGFTHIDEDVNGKKDFTKIIEHAKKCASPTEIEKGEIVGGFAHNQVLALADKVVDAVKSGAIKKFFVMAGCDGRMKSREYYTEFAQKLPKDTVILTAGCAKYRYNKLPLGDIGGIPRVLDAGQCNDSYSLALIALKLKEVFGLDDINKLPIAYNIAWYEQKAVIVLLALLYLGVKNIYLGPTLPAFLSPNVAKVLVEQFGISKIGNVEDDLKLFMN